MFGRFTARSASPRPKRQRPHPPPVELPPVEAPSLQRRAGAAEARAERRARALDLAAARQAARRQGAAASPADRGDQSLGDREAVGGRGARSTSAAGRPIRAGRAHRAQRAGAGRFRRRDHRRDDRPRADRAAAQGPDHQRHPDQRPRMRLYRARRHARADAACASRTRRICCASSTRSSSAVGRRVDEIAAAVRRAPARRLAHQHRGPADRGRRAAGVDPQVLQEAVQPEEAGRGRRACARRWPRCWPRP